MTYEEGIKNVPGHLKRAYTEGFKAAEKRAYADSGVKYLAMRHGGTGASLFRPISKLWGGPGMKMTDREEEIANAILARLQELKAQKKTTGDVAQTVSRYLAEVDPKSTRTGYELERNVAQHLGVKPYDEDDPVRQAYAEGFKAVDPPTRKQWNSRGYRDEL